MTTLYIDICPVKGKEHIDPEDMHWAVVNAGLGLSYKHKISISLDSTDILFGYRIKACGNDDVMEKFLKNPGRRLRGISRYLLQYWPEKYRPLMIGKRFFNYHVCNVIKEEQRICTACGKVMTSGYCINDGEEYYCSEKCLLSRYSAEECTELYNHDLAYWTEWY